MEITIIPPAADGSMDMGTPPKSETDEIFDSRLIRKYVVPLPRPITLTPPCRTDGVDRYRVRMLQVTRQLHPDLPGPTTLWAYDGSVVPLLFEARTKRPIDVEWVNDLPTEFLLKDSLDHTIMGAGRDVPDVRNVVHVHGGEQASDSDGYPEAWYVPGQSRVFHYPNAMPPTTMWFHDHAIGITRLNTYSGLAGGFYILRDPVVEKPLRLPRGRYELFLSITDKSFKKDGQLFYPVVGVNPEVHPHWVPAFLGNTLMTNGALWPFVKVEPRKYRLRFLNACGTRTLNFKLHDELTGEPGPSFVQIGSDSGYLTHPVILNDPKQGPEGPTLLLMSASRADVIIDFGAVPVGTSFILRNTAPGTFPEGKVPDPDTVGQIMKFVVVARCCDKSKDKSLIRVPRPPAFEPLKDGPGVVHRQFMLTVAGMGSTMPTGLFMNNTHFGNPAGLVKPELGNTEVWSWVNLTNGAHPQHIHLVDVQVLNRQPFDVKRYIADWTAQNPGVAPGAGNPHPLDVTPYLTGPPILPTGTEAAGQFDVVPALPGLVTRVILKWASALDKSKPFPFDATKGRFVFHCHVLEHEDQDFMGDLQLVHKRPCCNDACQLLSACF